MKCPGCNATGKQIRQMGPMSTPQIQQCNECDGTGDRRISVKDLCPQCIGQQVVPEEKILEVHVEKGMQNGHKITFPGEADQSPYLASGDIVFVVTQNDHPRFERKGDDLFVEHTLSLIEALCGFQFALTHLDGRQLLVKANPGEFVKPNSYKEVNDEGMPGYQKPFMRGKLFIHFTVEFPESLTGDQCKALEGVLPARTLSQLSDIEVDESEETTLLDVNIEEMRNKQAQPQPKQEAYNEDDDDIRGGTERVQCAQQ
ncbi:hypothetical protein MKW94_025189 [Papaver nudicaule]|uniref:Chaperone DnaJ C-terminal domain-containing protein n=1 Tax=Papaver nudicaule TaxID=74823 RepID=A0AA41SKR6_PAPNU|nr:hypothetical protein [Papaver nudicaule]